MSDPASSVVVRNRVVCAWCQQELRPGVLPTSHGICGACQQVYFPDSHTVPPADGAKGQA